ncbi:MAG: hypothetical protein ACLTYW_00860 [Collinsella sp.]
MAEVRSVTGNRCPRGDKFAHQELTCPMRVLTTTAPYLAATSAATRAHGRSHPAELHAQAMASSEAWSSTPSSAWATSSSPDLLNTTST